MKITISPTGSFERVNGIETRLWRGRTEKGTEVVLYIALVRAERDADNSELVEALKEVKASRQLVSFDVRLAL